MIDKKQLTLNEFVDMADLKFDEIEKLAIDNKNNKEVLEYLNKTIVPRLSQRPAVFANIESMQACTALNDGDYCMLFTKPEESLSIFVKVYQIRDINFREERKVLLSDPELAAYEVKQSGADVEIVNDLIQGGIYKALSAEQGKVLNKRLNLLVEQTIEELDEKIETRSNRLRDSYEALVDDVNKQLSSMRENIRNEFDNLNNEFDILNNDFESYKEETTGEINSISGEINSISSHLKALEDAVYNDITGNPFSASFKNLDGINLTKGIFNKSKSRLEC